MSDFKATFAQLTDKIEEDPDIVSASQFDGRCPDCLGKVTSEWMGCPHPEA